LPENAIMQSADLQLKVKDVDFENGTTGNRLVNPAQSNNFYLRSIKETDENLTAYTLDSSFVGNLNQSFDMRVENDTLSMSGTVEQEKFAKNKIQGIVNKTDQTEWFYLQYSDEKSRTSVVRLFGNTGQDSVRMHLRYFLVENSGF